MLERRHRLCFACARPPLATVVRRPAAKPLSALPYRLSIVHFSDAAASGPLVDLIPANASSPFLMNGAPDDCGACALTSISGRSAP
jgi:hypothetical protein